MSILRFFALSAALAVAFPARSNDLLRVDYPPSSVPGELSVKATYHLWLPPKVKRVRAVIVHQHGCGEGAERSGVTAALDLHWRALAERHDAALLSPHYTAGTNKCNSWCDPRNGSDAAFRRALADFARQSGHAELTDAPWCLWGHSGGGYWVTVMLALHAERVVAVFGRSGAAMMWQKDLGDLAYPEAAFGVPAILNPGIKERDDGKFNGAWLGTLNFFEHFRTRGAPVAFAPDPLSGHECRNSRLLAIPFFDACLEQRLPMFGHELKPVKQRVGYVCDWQEGTIRRARGETNKLSWLPSEHCARAFRQYTRHGLTEDTTPPEFAPVITNTTRSAEGVILEWSARADLESGIQQFAIYRNGKLLTRFPENPKDTTGFPQFQTLSYHDTPTPDAPKLRFVDNDPPRGSVAYAISIINGAKLEGPRSKAAKL